MSILPRLRWALAEWMLDRRDRDAIQVAVGDHGDGGDGSDGRHPAVDGPVECWSVSWPGCPGPALAQRLSRTGRPGHRTTATRPGAPAGVGN